MRSVRTGCGMRAIAGGDHTVTGLPWPTSHCGYQDVLPIRSSDVATDDTALGIANQDRGLLALPEIGAVGLWPLQSSLGLIAVPDDVPAARRHTRQVLRSWGFDVAVDDTELVVSELVSNAVAISAFPWTKFRAAYPLSRLTASTLTCWLSFRAKPAGRNRRKSPILPLCPETRKIRKLARTELSHRADHLLAIVRLWPTGLAVTDGPGDRYGGVRGRLSPNWLCEPDLVLEESAARSAFNDLAHRRSSAANRMGWPVSGALAPDWSGAACIDTSCPSRTCQALTSFEVRGDASNRPQLSSPRIV